MKERFDYQEAFSRNLGWVTATEQQWLRTRRVAIAGLGGVGGSHLLTLTRLGIGAFNIADLDEFELANFNRQAGASLDSVGRPKVEVLAELAKHIDPELDLRLFPQGVQADNLDDFLDGVDLYLDGLDFFAVEARRRVFAACAERGIPAVTAAPLGMGVALLNFLPGAMTFEEYFGMEGRPEEEQLMRFLIGLSPAMLQMGYLVDATRVDLAAHKGPSTAMACDLCAGVAATQVLKILLRRGEVIAAPRGLHFDAYRNRMKITRRPGGNRHPLQRLMLGVVKRRLAREPAQPAKAPEAAPPDLDPALARILDLARWAPSGDNTQPWRFEVRDGRHFLIHAHDTRDWCVYDLDGHASQIAVGALLETIAIAASGEGLAAAFAIQPTAGGHRFTIEATLTPRAEAAPDPLLPYIQVRCTNRRPLATTPLSADQKARLEAAVGEGYRLQWVEGEGRGAMARLLFDSARIRLTIPEAYQVHRRIIEWRAQFSADRIPDQAVGLDPVTVRLMEKVMRSWRRVRFMNRFLAGTLAPRVQLDLIPGRRCAAHFVLLADVAPAGLEGWLSAGRAVQRLWLTAASLGLQFQPEMTPLIFARYHHQGVAFTEDRSALEAAGEVARRLAEITGLPEVAEAGVFMGRLGLGPWPAARSLRKPLSELLESPAGG